MKRHNGQTFKGDRHLKSKPFVMLPFVMMLAMASLLMVIATGLPQAYAEAADVRVKMPMMGKADSLNAAVAAAVMAYEVLNQQRS